MKEVYFKSFLILSTYEKSLLGIQTPNIELR